MNSIPLPSSCPQRLSSVTHEAWEGGGMLGHCYTSVIEALDSWQIPITHHAGTSAGAITALLRCLQYSASEIQLIQSTTPWRKFAQYRPPALYRLIHSKGWFPIDYAKSWIEERITTAGFTSNITFKELYQKTGHSLYVTATRYQQYLSGPVECAPIIFSVETTPDSTPVALAVLASMAVPGFWPPVKIGDFYFCDGGVSANLPLMIFKDQPPEKVLGIRIDSHLEIEESLNPLSAKNISAVKPTIKDLVLANFNMCRTISNQSHIPEEFWSRVIRIDVGSEPALDFRSNDERMERLRRAGVEALEKFVSPA